MDQGESGYMNGSGYMDRDKWMVDQDKWTTDKWMDQGGSG